NQSRNSSSKEQPHQQLHRQQLGQPVDESSDILARATESIFFGSELGGKLDDFDFTGTLTSNVKTESTNTLTHSTSNSCLKDNSLFDCGIVETLEDKTSNDLFKEPDAKKVKSVDHESISSSQNNNNQTSMDSDRQLGRLLQDSKDCASSSN